MYSRISERIKTIINDPLTRNSLKSANMLSKKMKIMCLPIKYKSVWLSVVMGKSIGLVRKFAPGLFIKLKEQEVHGA